jgi:hypothetical protein
LVEVLFNQFRQVLNVLLEEDLLNNEFWVFDVVALLVRNVQI